MSKIKLQKDIVDIHSDYPITWKDIKNLELEDDDKIYIGYEDPYYIENNSWDGFYYCRVERMVEETDKEYEDRMEIKRSTDAMLKKNRYEKYLKLKKEFEEG